MPGQLIPGAPGVEASGRDPDGASATRAAGQAADHGPATSSNTERMAQLVSAT